MPLPHLRIRLRLAGLRLALLALAAGSLVGVARAARFDWLPVTAEELAQPRPVIEADAPAEALFWKIDIDDDRLAQPALRSEYIRYKIFAPEQVEELMRKSIVEEFRSNFKMRARLTLPDGTQREFGRESIRTRVYDRDRASGYSNREHFLAVTGVQPGAILEFLTERPWSLEYWRGFQWFITQLDDVPVRSLEFTFRIDRNNEAPIRMFSLNVPGAVSTPDQRHKILRVTGRDLPSLRTEPQLGPVTDFAATILIATVPANVTHNLSSEDERKADAALRKITRATWTEFALWAWVAQHAGGRETPRIRELATQICTGAKDDLEKAQRIHRWVQELFVRYRRNAPVTWTNFSVHPDRVFDTLLDFEKPGTDLVPNRAFFELALALYGAAGLKVETALLPDRRLVRFHPEHCAAVFLPARCAVIQIGERWHFSYPLPSIPAPWLDTEPLTPTHETVLLPFDMLPWQHEGQVALLGRLGRADFIPVPLSEPKDSQIERFGVLTLDEQGNLRGEARRISHGHVAAALRKRFAGQPAELRKLRLRDLLADELGAVEVEITRVSGFDDATGAVTVDFKLSWPNFAVRSGDRLLVRPGVFQCERVPRFPAALRHHPVHFEFPQLEHDRFGLILPPGFAPEALPETPALEMPGAWCRTEKTFDARRRLLTVDRTWITRLIDVDTPAYGPLKAWFDTVAREDRAVLSFRRTPGANSATP